VTIIEDVDEVARKLVALKTVFPKANAFKVSTVASKIVSLQTKQGFRVE
jgi:hypothetical protein